MIAKMEIDAIHGEVTDEVKKYVQKKIGKLDKYMPRHARESAHAEVKLILAKAKEKRLLTCEVILFLPHDVITTKETTMNMFASIDIVETKLKNQLKKYKEKHSSLNISRRVLSKVRNRRNK